jgi:hypothetical protein
MKTIRAPLMLASAASFTLGFSLARYSFRYVYVVYEPEPSPVVGAVGEAIGHDNV